jgi:hypothetical protein
MNVSALRARWSGCDNLRIPSPDGKLSLRRTPSRSRLWRSVPWQRPRALESWMAPGQLGIDQATRQIVSFHGRVVEACSSGFSSCGSKRTCPSTAISIAGRTAAWISSPSDSGRTSCDHTPVLVCSHGALPRWPPCPASGFGLAAPHFAFPHHSGHDLCQLQKPETRRACAASRAT